MKVTYRGALTEGAAVYVDDEHRHVTFMPGVAEEVSDEFGRRILDDHPADFKGDGGYDPHPAESAGKAAWETYRASQGHVVDGLKKDELIKLPDAPAGEEG